VNWVVIRARSDKDAIRQIITIDMLNGACLNWWTFTDEEKEALGLPTNSSVKKERVFDAYYFAGFGRELFYYTLSPGQRLWKK
jgi:hypothetical protein